MEGETIFVPLAPAFKGPNKNRKKKSRENELYSNICGGNENLFSTFGSTSKSPQKKRQNEREDLSYFSTILYVYYLYLSSL